MWCKQKYFYYHFKDIPDVVEFILKKKWDEILEHPQDRSLYSGMYGRNGRSGEK